MTPSFAHVIAPFVARPGSEWDIAQRITVETMRQARYATNPDVRVRLLATVFAEDEQAVPEGFERIEDLRRSVLNKQTFHIPKKLPLLRDILENAVAAADTDYIVYTNADIALQPHFYDAITGCIAQGQDAIVINRRTIAPHWRSVEDIPAMQKDVGKPHRGYDCFVFRRDAFPRFVLGDVCLGTSHVDLPLIASMIATAHDFRLYENEHLTFHIGDSLTWMRWKLRDYRVYNDREACRAVQTLAAGRDLGPLASLLLRINLPHNAIIVRELLRAFNQASPRSERLSAERKDVALEVTF